MTEVGLDSANVTTWVVYTLLSCGPVFVCSLFHSSSPVPRDVVVVVWWWDVWGEVDVW